MYAIKRKSIISLKGKWLSYPQISNRISKSNVEGFSGGSKGGARDARPLGPNSSNFMQFLVKFGKIVCWHPPGCWRLLLGGILDPPLGLLIPVPSFWNFNKINSSNSFFFNFWRTWDMTPAILDSPASCYQKSFLWYTLHSIQRCSKKFPLNEHEMFFLSVFSANYI